MSARATSPTATTLPEAAGFFLLAALPCSLALLWLWAGLAGSMFGDGWPHGLSLADHAHVAARLPCHVDDPAAAWPRPARNGLPGAAAFYALLGMMLSAAGVLVTIVVVAGRRVGLCSGSRAPSRSSRWARARDVRRLVVRAPRAGRLVLGRVAGRLVAAEQRHSVIVIAPTQSGKTTGLAVPAVLEWQGPVLACSIKTDLLRDTLAHRARMGEVKVFDPTEITGFPRAGWTPLGASHTWQDARETADRLVASAQPALQPPRSDETTRRGAGLHGSGNVVAGTAQPGSFASTAWVSWKLTTTPTKNVSTGTWRPSACWTSWCRSSGRTILSPGPSIVHRTSCRVSAGSGR
jgi:type IV secretion system protein VirD4